MFGRVGLLANAEFVGAYSLSLSLVSQVFKVLNLSFKKFRNYLQNLKNFSNFRHKIPNFYPKNSQNSRIFSLNLSISHFYGFAPKASRHYAPTLRRFQCLAMTGLKFANSNFYGLPRGFQPLAMTTTFHIFTPNSAHFAQNHIFSHSAVTKSDKFHSKEKR